MTICRGVIEGELYFSTLDRAPYAHDASIFEIDPWEWSCHGPRTTW